MPDKNRDQRGWCSLGDNAFGCVVLLGLPGQEELRNGVLLWGWQPHAAVLSDHSGEEVIWDGHQTASTITCSAQMGCGSPTKPAELHCTAISPDSCKTSYGTTNA